MFNSYCFFWCFYLCCVKGHNCFTQHLGQWSNHRPTSCRREHWPPQSSSSRGHPRWKSSVIKTMVGNKMAVCQNLVPLVNIKIAGKWMFIPLKMVLIGIDPYPHGHEHSWKWPLLWLVNYYGRYYSDRCWSISNYINIAEHFYGWEWGSGMIIPSFCTFSTNFFFLHSGTFSCSLSWVHQKSSWAIYAIARPGKLLVWSPMANVLGPSGHLDPTEKTLW